MRHNGVIPDVLGSPNRGEMTFNYVNLVILSDAQMIKSHNAIVFTLKLSLPLTEQCNNRKVEMRLPGCVAVSESGLPALASAVPPCWSTARPSGHKVARAGPAPPQNC